MHFSDLGQEQLFHPTSEVSTGFKTNPDIKTQVDASPKGMRLALKLLV